MPTLADLLTWRADLFAARARGIREVRDATGESVTYKSDSEMAAAMAALDSEISLMRRGPRPSFIRVGTSKGL